MEWIVKCAEEAARRRCTVFVDAKRGRIIVRVIGGTAEHLAAVRKIAEPLISDAIVLEVTP